MQHTPDLPSNTGMQRTARCAHKIGAFLKAGISPIVFPIYRCAAADAQPVVRHPSLSYYLTRRGSYLLIHACATLFIRIPDRSPLRHEI
jgi:hypothetical protein